MTLYAKDLSGAGPHPVRTWRAPDSEAQSLAAPRRRPPPAALAPAAPAMASAAPARAEALGAGRLELEGIGREAEGLEAPRPARSLPPRRRPPAVRRRRQRRFYRDRAKRALDVALVLLSAPVTLPLIAVMALLVSLDGGAPFFRQRRLGRAGRVFGLWKIRTMVRDADAQLEAHLAASPAAAAEWHATQKLRHDPRVTRVGRLLRKTSLDELPQFWNVLAGDMALIGPRPMMVEQAALYPGRAYYALRPGITGPWQVSDRNATTFAARAEYDQAYYDGLSLGLDAAIFLRTFAVILLCTGR